MADRVARQSRLTNVHKLLSSNETIKFEHAMYSNAEYAHPKSLAPSRCVYFPTMEDDGHLSAGSHRIESERDVHHHSTVGTNTVS